MHKYKEEFTAKTHPSQPHLYMNNSMHKNDKLPNCRKIYALGSIPFDPNPKPAKLFPAPFTPLRPV